MDAGTQTIEKLFESSRQIFQIPTFQRPYVWRLETQWEPLWEDVRELAERYGDLLTEHGDRGAAQKAAGRHFLGAVVVQRVDKPFGAPETWEIIDGQQRLTTLQLLLHAAHEVFLELGLDHQAVHFERVVVNDKRACQGDDLFKLWPTGGDREAFAAVMTRDGDDDAHVHSLVVEAHRFFETQIREWLSDTIEPSTAERAEHLLVALLALLELVVIKLDGSDDAFTIFETLNARGTPLLAADLVKNFVLQTAVRQHKEQDAFHARYWKQFEEHREPAGKAPWWLMEIRQGRLFRPRLDVFLNHWLVLRVKAEVKSRDLFTTFKDHVESVSSDDIEPVVKHFVHVADAYRRLESWPAQSREGRFLYRWNVVQAGVLTPVLLQLFSADAKLLSEDRRRRALGHLESFLVRRLICRMTTKGYNNFFLELVGTVDEQMDIVDDAIRDFFLRHEADARAWPTDSQVVEAITNQPLYGRINQGRIRMVLEGIEEDLRTSKAESTEAPRNLQLEHVMPRKWHAHWPLPLNEDPEAHHRAVERRNRLIDTLGNLTLVHGKLNASISNGPWEDKCRELDKHSTLFLNKALLREHSEAPFDDAAIEARSRALGKLACSVWPRPAGEKT